MNRLTIPFLTALALSACTVIPESDRVSCDPSAEQDPCPDGLVCLADDPLDEDAAHGATTYGLCGVDDDGDGWRAALDCDDTDAEVHPGALERCDGIDQDCDGVVDNDASDAGAWFVDSDGDGFGIRDGAVWACEAPDGHVGNPEDCDDTDPAIRPGTDELCDGIDNDCDDAVDEDAVDRVETWKDRDDDGFGWGTTILSCTVLEGEVLNDEDCNDWNADEFPGNTARDYPGDGIDNDCDGEEGPPCEDLDCDGYPDLYFNNYWNTGGLNDAYVYYSTGGPLGADATAQTLATARQGLDASVADLDQDGYIDLITPINGGRSRIYWGRHPDRYDPYGIGTGDMTELSTHSSHDVCVGDVGGEGHLDLLFPSNSDHGPSWMYTWTGGLLSDGGRTDLGNSRGGNICLMDDFDGDGHLDALLPRWNQTGHSTRVLWGSATVLDTSDETGIAGASVVDALSEDLDGDGNKDLVLIQMNEPWTSNDNVPTLVYWGSTLPYSNSDRTDLPATRGLHVQAEDLDEDGHVDLIVTQRDQVDVHWGQPSADGAVYESSRRFRLEAGTQLSDAEVNDIDDDGFLDLIVIHGRHRREASIYWGDGSRTPWRKDGRTDLEVGFAMDLAIADLDANGQLDIVFGAWSEHPDDASWVHPELGADRAWTGPAWVYRNWSTDDGAFEDAFTLEVQFSNHVEVIGADCVNETCND